MSRRTTWTFPSSERLEDVLKQFTSKQEGFGENLTGGGTLILITHDRMLLEDLVDQLLILDGHGNVRHFTGTYSEFVAAEKAASAGVAGAAADAKRVANRKRRHTVVMPQPPNRSREKVRRILAAVFRACRS